MLRKRRRAKNRRIAEGEELEEKGEEDGAEGKGKREARDETKTQMWSGWKAEQEHERARQT